MDNIPSTKYFITKVDDKRNPITVNPVANKIKEIVTTVFKSIIDIFFFFFNFLSEYS